MDYNKEISKFYESLPTDKLYILTKIGKIKELMGSDSFKNEDVEIQYLVKRQVTLLENYLWNSSDIVNRLVEINNEEYFSPER